MITSEISSSDITNPSKTFKADHAKSDAFICDKPGVWVVVAGETELFIGWIFSVDNPQKGTIQMNDSVLKHRILRYMLAQ